MAKSKKNKPKANHIDNVTKLKNLKIICLECVKRIEPNDYIELSHNDNLDVMVTTLSCHGINKVLYLRQSELDAATPVLFDQLIPVNYDPDIISEHKELASMEAYAQWLEHTGSSYIAESALLQKGAKNGADWFTITKEVEEDLVKADTYGDDYDDD